MYQSKFYIPTSKNNVKDAKIVSHELLIKSGYAYQHAAGIYTYLPLATRVLNNIEKVIKEEIEKIGACEVKMPFLQPSELWEKSERWQNYGQELFRVTDRHSRDFALAPTHEEVATDILISYMNSYKKYPMNIYQIQTKMRDERRPRFGLLRSREFIMFDGYSFDVDHDSLMKVYNEYYDAYKKILDRFELDYKIVMADNGSMGGSSSHEFMVLSEVGEDTICYEQNSELGYNVEAAPVKTKYEMEKDELKMIEEIHTPNIKTIDELAAELKVEKNKLVKCVAYESEGQLILTFVMGDKEVQEVKLMRYLNVDDIELASDELLKKYNLEAGSIGMVGISPEVKVIVDNEIAFKVNVTCGANKKDYHMLNVNLTRDVEKYELADIREIQEGDILREGGEPVKLIKGIEVGHIFALGERYTKSFNMKFLDKNQKEQTPLMGCYGIGVSRILSAFIEQKHVDKRVKFNKELSPFDFHLIPLDYVKNDEQREYTEKLKEELIAKGYSVLVDDRNERVGSKLNDAELIGCNRQIIIGRTFTENILEELQLGEKIKITREEIIKGE